jgi:hypothetical protein
MTAALLQFGIGSAQLTTRRFHLATAGFELFRHAVERRHQVTQFVGCGTGHAMIQIALGDLLGRFRQGGYRASHKLREIEREPGADK